MKSIMKISLVFVLALNVMGIRAGAQNQDQSSGSSLGDYARHARKTSGNSSKPKVYDNDNLPTKENLSIIGPAPATENGSDAKPAEPGSSTSSGEAKPNSEAKPNAEPKPPSPDGKAEEGGASKSSTTEKSSDAGAVKTAEQDQAEKEAAWKQWGEKLKSQKDQIDLLAREVEVLQREYQIRAAAMYADAGNRLRNQADWDKQDAQYKQQIADKQKQLDDAKQKLEDLSEEARKAGVPASVREP